MNEDAYMHIEQLYFKERGNRGRKSGREDTRKKYRKIEGKNKKDGNKRKKKETKEGNVVNIKRIRTGGN